jgi:KipI family sensor histidine kinase inhibitor
MCAQKLSAPTEIMKPFPKFAPLGDDALLVTFAHEASWEAGVLVRSAASRIRAMRVDTVTDVVPAYTTLSVHFDGARISFDGIVAAIAPALTSPDTTPADDSRLIEIPVRYDGPDLAEVAERTGMTVAEVMERHSSRTYRAYLSGFAPGFAYLGDLDESLILPRRSSPRVRVPAGSVAIAAAQTAVYPLETPGGWHLIGSTECVMFDAQRDPPALIRAGDTVRFIDISR